ncbi:VOC family protein [Afipia sp. Root123D2]|uniref:VOC family protein n=1 Tax=Afipia sp. Root123D2 TaxID=1736436 RepID=UPI000AD45354
MSRPHDTGNVYTQMLRTAWLQAARTLANTECAMAAHGHFHWNELLTPEVEQAKQFYRDTIGWSFEPMPMDDGATYWVAQIGKEPVAGIFPTNRPDFAGVPVSWMSYLSVDNVDTRVRKAVNGGAKLMRPIFDVPNVGRIAILTEPGGAGIGWITPVACAEAA